MESEVVIKVDLLIKLVNLFYNRDSHTRPRDRPNRPEPPRGSDRIY